MLSSIHPLGEAGRGNRYTVTASGFLIGSIVGGLATATVAGAFGVILGWGLGAIVAPPFLQAVALAIVMAVGAWAKTRQLGGRPLPCLARQVNENWLNEFRGWVYGAGFGLQLGSGVATHIRSAAVFVWLATLVVVGDLIVALALGATFGLARGVTIFTTRGVHTPEDLMVFHRLLHADPRLLHRKQSKVSVQS